MGVRDLIGVPLDALFARATGAVNHNGMLQWPDGSRALPKLFKPSTSWSCGGPFLFKHQVATYPTEPAAGFDPSMAWCGYVFVDGRKVKAYGRDPLVAGTRAIVASVYGDEVPA